MTSEAGIDAGGTGHAHVPGDGVEADGLILTPIAAGPALVLGELEFSAPALVDKRVLTRALPDRAR